MKNVTAIERNEMLGIVDEFVFIDNDLFPFIKKIEAHIEKLESLTSVFQKDEFLKFEKQVKRLYGMIESLETVKDAIINIPHTSDINDFITKHY